jgi:hypothetical protein
VAISEGFYDGRFRPRVVKDKKKERDMATHSKKESMTSFHSKK